MKVLCYLLDTSAFNAFAVLFVLCINLLTYLLTYLPACWQVRDGRVAVVDSDLVDVSLVSLVGADHVGQSSRDRQTDHVGLDVINSTWTCPRPNNLTTCEVRLSVRASVHDNRNSSHIVSGASILEGGWESNLPRFLKWGFEEWSFQLHFQLISCAWIVSVRCGG